MKVRHETEKNIVVDNKEMTELVVSGPKAHYYFSNMVDVGGKGIFAQGIIDISP